MKSSIKILIAFLLNLSFSVFEFFGGLFTGSVAIISDAYHDLADALSIGIAFFLEKKSNKKADEKYTYGYKRYSVLSSLLLTVILIVGSLLIIAAAIKRLKSPMPINYDGMIVFAIVGIVVNFCAAYFTHKGESLNQKAVSLHMIEDVLSWVVVLFGAVVMRFTDFHLLDIVMSVLIAIFVMYNALRNLKKAIDIFLLKTPKNVSISKLKEDIEQICGVKNVHHLHIWSIDGTHNCASLHVVSKENEDVIRHKVQDVLRSSDVVCSTIQVEHSACEYTECTIQKTTHLCHHHH